MTAIVTAAAATGVLILTLALVDAILERASRGRRRT